MSFIRTRRRPWIGSDADVQRDPSGGIARLDGSTAIAFGLDHNYPIWMATIEASTIVGAVPVTSVTVAKIWMVSPTAEV